MNFDNYIENMLNSGKSMDVIAQEMTRALNDARRKQEEKEKIQKAFDAKRNACVDILRAAVDTDTFDSKVLAAATVLVNMESGAVNNAYDADETFNRVVKGSTAPRSVPGPKYSKEEREFYTAIEQLANEIADEIADEIEKELSKSSSYTYNKSKIDGKEEDKEKVDNWLRAAGLK